MEGVQDVTLAPAGIFQLTDGSLLGGNTPLAWNLDVETFTKNPQVPELIHVQSAARHDLVILQRIGQGIVPIAERFASLQAIHLTLFKARQQERVNLMRQQGVKGRYTMLVHVRACAIMIE